VSDVRITAYGDSGLLLELGSSIDSAGWATALRAAALQGVLDIVPAAGSVLLLLTDDAEPADVAAQVVGMQPLPLDNRHETATDGEVVEIPVVYDGPDLAEVGELTGLSPEEVVRAHCEQTWWVAFAGFAPGFAYLTGGDPRLVVPRRVSPRTRVPEGAVALAAGYSAVYPRASPGGWQLIGLTTARMWDLAADPPALLRPGGRVRFVAVGR
jgi:KipI family sensor histidine kinase inhibitor